MTVIPLNTNSSDNVTYEISSSLKSFSPFQGLSDTLLSAIEETADYRSYKAGETLVSHGQYEGEAFYIVASGALKVTIINPETGAVYIETLSVGSSFGLDIALAEDSESVARNVTLSAEQDTNVWIMDSYSFVEVITNRPSLAKNLLFFLSSEFLKSRFKSFEFSTSPETLVYKALLDMVMRDEISGAWKIQNMPKHRELAEISGVEEEQAASAVAILIQENIAMRDYPGLIIIDMARLNKIST